jgi:hypothetical protein
MFILLIFTLIYFMVFSPRDFYFINIYINFILVRLILLNFEEIFFINRKLANFYLPLGCHVINGGWPI